MIVIYFKNLQKFKQIRYYYTRNGFKYGDSGLPVIDEDGGEWVNDEEQIMMNDKEHEKQFDTKHGMLNESQKLIFDLAIKALKEKDNKEKLIFIDGPGGSGKTFLFEVKKKN